MSNKIRGNSSQSENNSASTNARDFFLYLILGVTLVWLISSLFIYTFQLIDLVFPDPLNNLYYDSWRNSALLGAMASLIVVTPAYLGISAYLNRDLKQNPHKKNLWIRKWLLYAVLFVSFIVILVDLSLIVGSFLQGEMTARFAWKAVFVLLVTFSLFGYYFFELRRDPSETNRVPLISGLALGLAIFVLVVAGFIVAGSPTEQREKRLDAERVSDLQSIVWEIESFVVNNQEIPQSLDALRQEQIYGISLTDPVTNEPYVYNVTGEDQFELCANFARSSVGNSSENNGFYEPRPIAPLKASLQTVSGESIWEHEAGEECFEFEVRRNADSENIRIVPSDNADSEE